MSTRFPTLAESQDAGTIAAQSETSKAIKRTSENIDAVLRECERLQAENAELRLRYDGMVARCNELVDKLKGRRRDT
jgi:hypothetical protein